MTMLLLCLIAYNPTLKDAATAAMGSPHDDASEDRAVEASVSNLNPRLDISDWEHVPGNSDAETSNDMFVSVADAAASMGIFSLTFRVQMPPE